MTQFDGEKKIPRKIVKDIKITHGFEGKSLIRKVYLLIIDIDVIVGILNFGFIYTRYIKTKLALQTSACCL